MMKDTAPDDSVRIWLPEYLNHQTQCPSDKFTKALALAMVFDLENKVNLHDGHYHVLKDEEYGGFRVDEFVVDNDGLGEKWVGKTHLVHYHGVYVDGKAAQDFLSAVLGHQHGAR